MVSPNPVGISSQDARVDFGDDVSQRDMQQAINDAFILVRDDIQRLASVTLTKNVTNYGGSTYRSVASETGVARVWCVSDTATASSDGSNYHVLTLYRNGIAANSMTYDTRNAEIYAYRGGVYLGETQVTVGDVLSVDLSVTGSPSPTLTADNLIIRYRLREF